MRVLYAVDFSLVRIAGRTIGTASKYNQISSILAGSRLISLDSSRLYRALSRVGVPGVIAKSLALGEINLLLIWLCLILRRFDVAIVRGIPLLLRHVFAWRGVKVVSEVHADLGEEIRLTKKGALRLVAPLYCSFLDRQLRHSDGIIYNHPLLQSAMNRRLGITVPTIFSYNGADVERLAPADRVSTRDGLGIPRDRIVLVFAGSVSIWHGVDKVVRCFAELAKIREDVLLYIVGGSEGGMLGALRREFANLERVTYTGAVSREASIDYINAADLCILPVNNIRVSPGSPIKLYDYAACGKPIVTQKDVPGYSDVVLDNRLGIAVDFDDSAACARDIQALLSSGALGPVWEREIRRTAEAHLSWHAVVTHWIDYIVRLRIAS